MLKILKYEFRKSRTSLLAMLCIAAGLYLLSPLGRLLHRDYLMVLSLMLLFFYAFAAFFFVLIRGITAYSGELRGRTGYLLMLVPRSTMSILFGKLLFSLVFALLMMAVTLLALAASYAQLLPMMVGSPYSAQTLWNLVKIALYRLGITPMQLASIALFFAIEVLSSVLVLVGIGYLSVTLSATVLQGGRGRGFLSVLFFIALFLLTSWLQNLAMPNRIYLYPALQDAMRASLPSALTLLVLTCVYTAASAVLLKKKVSL